jgi:hypothetical protein
MKFLIGLLVVGLILAATRVDAQEFPGIIHIACIFDNFILQLNCI